MVIDKSGFKVIGEGSVTVIDGGTISYTDAPYVERNESLKLADVKLHVLSEDSRFDFKTRQIVIPKKKQHRAKASGAGDDGKTTSRKGR